MKTELGYSKIEHLLSVHFEQQLEKEVSQLFHEMEYHVIRNLAEYYNPDVMFKAHMDLILAPIHELHRKYYEILIKYKIREFDKSRAAGKRIVERMINFRRKGNVINKQFTVLKADVDLNDVVSSTISKDKLFGTSPIAHDNLKTRTYQLSEKTLARVDDNINDIITKGYEEGNGIDAVAKDVRKRFGQLKTWESKRIARTEIHNSQSLGVLQGYDDMGVQYIEWSSARDDRVRGLKPHDQADHYHLDGEIIRLGGVFSNGLMYPGDMAGPAKEVINCRCQVIPFIPPYGYIPPVGMAQFRESDLIATLDVFSRDDLIAQALAETTQIPQSVELDKFALDSSQLSLYKKLKAQEDELGFLKRRKLKDLEAQMRFNELHNQYLKEGKLIVGDDFDSGELQKEYLGLQNKLKDDLNITTLVEDYQLAGKPKPNVVENIVKIDKSKKPKPKLIVEDHNGVEYKDYSEVVEQIEDHMTEIQSKIPYKERHKVATRNYGGTWYDPINDLLYGNSSLDVNLKRNKLTKAQVQKCIDDLDDAFKITPGSKEPVTLWKGGDSRGLNLNPGARNTWKAFSSTSYDQSIAEEYYEIAKERLDLQGIKDAQPILFKIRAKTGTKGIYMDDTMQCTCGEAELLLNREQEFDVVQTYYDSELEMTICEIELIV